jgi:hypothetical protein
MARIARFHDAMPATIRTMGDSFPEHTLLESLLRVLLESAR